MRASIIPDKVAYLYHVTCHTEQNALQQYTYSVQVTWFDRNHKGSKEESTQIVCVKKLIPTEVLNLVIYSSLIAYNIMENT